jgi:CBS domain containing-hemolysin-like protein
VSDAPDLEGLGGNLSPSQSALSTMVGMIFPFKLPRRLITQGWVEIMLVVAAPISVYVRLTSLVVSHFSPPCRLKVAKVDLHTYALF